jgi:hypothetical protein
MFPELSWALMRAATNKRVNARESLVEAGLRMESSLRKRNRNTRVLSDPGGGL